MLLLSVCFAFFPALCSLNFLHVRFDVCYSFRNILDDYYNSLKISSALYSLFSHPGIPITSITLKNCSTVLGWSVLSFHYFFLFVFHFVKFLLDSSTSLIFFPSILLSLVKSLLKAFFIWVTVIFISNISFWFLQFLILCLYNLSILA